MKKLNTALFISNTLFITEQFTLNRITKDINVFFNDILLCRIIEYSSFFELFHKSQLGRIQGSADYELKYSYTYQPVDTKKFLKLSCKKLLGSNPNGELG